MYKIFIGSLLYASILCNFLNLRHNNTNKTNATFPAFDMFHAHCQIDTTYNARYNENIIPFYT